MSNKRHKPTEPAPTENADEDHAARFAFLLAPIKNLADNWNIDIAKVLESYLSELGEVVISIDSEEDGPKMNFAEAALLIQGSTSIYSKKVEYVYQLYTMLVETLARQRAMKDNQPQQNPSLDEQGNDRDAASLLRNDDFELVPLDDLQPSSDIDLDDTQPFDPSTLVRPLMPLSLVPLEEHEKSKIPLIGLDGQVIGRRDDFWVNTAIIHPSGALLLDACNASLINAFNGENEFFPIGDANQSQLLTLSPQGASIAAALISPNVPDGGQQAQDPIPPPIAEGTFTAGDLGAGDNTFDDFDPVSHDVEPQEVPQRSKRIFGLQEAKAAKKRKTRKDMIEEMQMNSWDELEFGEDNGTHLGDFRSKPFRAGRFYCAPTIGIPKSADKEQLPDEVLSDHFNNNIYGQNRKLPKGLWKNPYCPALYDLYLLERQGRLRAYKRRQRERENDDTNAVEHTQNGREPEVHNRTSIIDRNLYELFDAPPDDHNDHDDDDDDGAQDVIDDDILEDNHGGSGDNANIAVAATYEDLVRVHLEGILRDAENNIVLGELARRVQEWERRVEPILLEEETRRRFDIHEYGDDLLNFFEEAPTESSNAIQSYDFAQFARTQPRHEVCRYFLASLMLANTENVELSTSGEEGTTECLNTLNLTLLSRKRHHEQLEEFAGPSTRN